ncbi:restriction endonuclease [Flavobacterium sp.]|uniref:restriction endonuclease n=1 Tax=Flavobacterium sp. TaxID=239 RepID=UPI003D6BAAD9
MKIIKNSGDIVDFNPEKLRKSLLRSGADAIAVEGIMAHIHGKLHNGMRTREIYRLAGKMLKKISASHAARYNLRAAIQQLGPAGFFFEKFVSLLFMSEGYITKTNLMLQGNCVLHEIDIVLKKMDILTMVECKFHAGSNAVSDVKVPMYILSRFNDIKDSRHQIFSNSETIDKCLIVTNNRFTVDAITFAGCSGLEMLSWDYPSENNLKTKIDIGVLYPLTCLTTLSMVEKEKLLILNIILVKQLIDSSDTLLKIGVSEGRKKNILNEAAGLCNYFIK